MYDVEIFSHFINADLSVYYWMVKGKGKVIPLQARCDPVGG